MTANELTKEMEKIGWYFEREGKGSHQIYRHRDLPYPISIPYHGKKDLSKDYYRN